MKSIILIYLCLVIISLQSCDDSQNSMEEKRKTLESQKGALEQGEKMDTNVKPFITEEQNSLHKELDSSKTKVLIIPCSNCYTCSTKGYELNSVIENVLKKNATLEVIPFSHKKFCKNGCIGIKDHAHAQYLLKISKADFLVSTRIYGKCTPYRAEKDGKWIMPNSGDKSWGYAIKITNSTSIYKKQVIYVKGLKFFESIEQHLLKNIAQVIENLKQK